MLRVVLHPRRADRARPPCSGRWCGASAPSCRALGWERSGMRCAMSPVSAGRSGGSGAMPEAVLAALLAAGGKLVAGQRVTRIRCAGDAVRGVTLEDGTEYRRTGRRVGLRPAPHVPRVAHEPAAGRPLRRSPAGAPSTSRLDTSRSSTPSSTAPPVLTAIGTPTGSTITVAPSLAEIDRGFHEMQAGRRARSSGAAAQRPHRARSDDGAHRSPASSRAEPRSALHAVRAAGRLARLARAAALAGTVRVAVRTGCARQCGRRCGP